MRNWFLRLMTWRARRQLARVRAADAAMWTAAESRLREEAAEAHAYADKHFWCHPSRARLRANARRLECLAMAAHYRAGGDTTSAELHEANALFYAQEAVRYVTRETTHA